MSAIRIGKTDYGRPLSVVAPQGRFHYVLASRKAALGYDRVPTACTAAAGLIDFARIDLSLPLSNRARASLTYWASLCDKWNRGGNGLEEAAKHADGPSGVAAVFAAVRARLRDELDSISGRTPSERADLAVIKALVAVVEAAQNFEVDPVGAAAASARLAAQMQGGDSAVVAHLGSRLAALLASARSSEEARSQVQAAAFTLGSLAPVRLRRLAPTL